MSAKVIPFPSKTKQPIKKTPRENNLNPSWTWSMINSFQRERWITDWECEFLCSVSKQITVSEKQHVLIEKIQKRIYEKARQTLGSN